MTNQTKFDDLGELSPGDIIYSAQWADGTSRKQFAQFMALPDEERWRAVFNALPGLQTW